GTFLIHPRDAELAAGRLALAAQPHVGDAAAAVGDVVKLFADDSVLDDGKATRGGIDQQPGRCVGMGGGGDEQGSDCSEKEVAERPWVFFCSASLSVKQALTLSCQKA